MRNIKWVISATLLAGVFNLIISSPANCLPLNRIEKKPAFETKAQSGKTQPAKLDFLRKYNGKYPYEVRLLKNAVLIQRLKKLLGKRYNFLVHTWATENPIEVRNNIFIASGCQAHNCGSTNFIIVVDFRKNVLYTGIREEEKVKIYAEDGSSNKELNSWANFK